MLFFRWGRRTGGRGWTEQEAVETGINKGTGRNFATLANILQNQLCKDVGTSKGGMGTEAQGTGSRALYVKKPLKCFEE